jgi:hypothetical protein
MTKDMNNSFKKHLWIGTGIIVGSMAVAFIAFYLFSGYLRTRADNIIAEKTAAKKEASAIADFAALKTDAPKAAQYDVAIQKLLPSQSGLITFNAWVSQIAKGYGVIATVAYQGDPTLPTGATPGSAAFTMTAQGPENSIVPFVDYLSSRAVGFPFSFGSFNFTNDRTQENFTGQGTLYFK